MPEDHKANLGAFNMTPEAQALYEKSDLMIVVGSRLRGNETHDNKMRLPKPLSQIDADDTQAGRNYPVDMLIGVDAGITLQALLEQLPRKLDVDPTFAYEIVVARAKGEGAIRAAMGSYQEIADALLARVPAGRHPGCAM